MKAQGYPVVIERTGEETWLAYVPDLPGCTSVGDTEEVATWNIRQAVGEHLAALRETGQSIPSPSVTALDVEQLQEAIRAAQRNADFRAVERLGHELAACCRAAGDVSGEGNAYAYLGGAHVARNAGREAHAAYERSRELFERAGDRVGLARALNGLAVVALDIDLDLAEARRLADDVLPLARSSGDRLLLGVILGNLCEVQRFEGDYAGAIQSAREALAIMVECGNAPRAAWQLTNIAHCQFIQLDLHGAIASMREAYEYLVRGTYDARVVAWYFDVWFIIAAGGLREWSTAARILGFVNHYRSEKGLVRLQLLLPWLTAPTEELWRQLPGEKVAELMRGGESLSIEDADALTRNPQVESPAAEPKELWIKWSLSQHELRELFTIFLGRMQAGGPVRGFSGSGIIEGFSVHDPAWRFVLDAREPARPGHAFELYVNDDSAPEPSVEIFVGGETLDKAFCGELHVRSAMAVGLVRYEGDQRAAIRLLPIMLNVVPFYRALRSEYIRTRRARSTR